MSAESLDNLRELGRRLAKARRVVKGTCRVCKREFTGAANRRYCSDRCRWHHYRHREREERFSLQHRLSAVRVGSAEAFLDQDGSYWVRFSCLSGPKEGEPGFPAEPAAKVLEASYRALFMAYAAEARNLQSE